MEVWRHCQDALGIQAVSCGLGRALTGGFVLSSIWIWRTTTRTGTRRGGGDWGPGRTPCSASSFSGKADILPLLPLQQVPAHVTCHDPVPVTLTLPWHQNSAQTLCPIGCMRDPPGHVCGARGRSPVIRRQEAVRPVPQGSLLRHAVVCACPA